MSVLKSLLWLPLKLRNRSRRTHTFIRNAAGFFFNFNSFHVECLSKKQTSSIVSLCILLWPASARSFAHSLARWRRKTQQGHAKTSGERKWKIQIDGQKGWNFYLSETAKKGRRHTEEGSGEQGYTFLWLQNTLSFNKGAYLPLCVI